MIPSAALAERASGWEAIDEVFPTGSRILFQGDSITDGAHWDDAAHQDHLLGDGYVYLIAAKLGARMPERRLHFINRGHSGNTVADLAARWQKDTLDLKPDFLSILIGVNDVWRNLHAGKAVPLNEIAVTYDHLLADTLRSLPGVKIVLGEPFLEPGFETQAKWDEWTKGLAGVRSIVARLAAKYRLPVVYYQALFDAACRPGHPEYWIFDGIHPIHSGHQLMADEWMRTVATAWTR